jgi:hypothetical protein
MPEERRGLVLCLLLVPSRPFAATVAKGSFGFRIRNATTRTGSLASLTLLSWVAKPLLIMVNWGSIMRIIDVGRSLRSP